MKNTMMNAFFLFSAAVFATMLFQTFLTAFRGDVAGAFIMAAVTVPLALMGFYTLRTAFQTAREA